jgi:hypothetical protein
MLDLFVWFQTITKASIIIDLEATQFVVCSEQTMEGKAFWDSHCINHVPTTMLLWLFK